MSTDESIKGTITRNGIKWKYTHEEGFYNHVLLLLKNIEPGTIEATSGRATVTRVIRKHEH